MHPHCRPPRRGVTIAEALVAMFVLALLSIGVCGLYVESLKMYNEGVHRTSAQQRASFAVQLMLSEIQEATNVDYPGPWVIVFTMPEKQDGLVVVDPETYTVVPGYQVAYYLSDSSGYYYREGPYIWRAQRPLGTEEWQEKRLVIEEVGGLTFTYAPTIEMPELVRASVTVNAEGEPGYFNRTEVGEVWLRNH